MRKYFFIFITILIFLGAPFLRDQQVHAGGMAVFDSIHTTLTGISWIKDDLVDIARDVAVKRLIDALSYQTINWINGGGSGKPPQYISDWRGFVSQEANKAVGDVILQTDAAALCSPFKLQVQLSLLPVEVYRERVACTLTDVVDNIDDFYDDFQNGGWLAYNKMWQPENNYFGLVLTSRDQMLIESDQKTEAAVNEGIAGKGFLSVKKTTCVEYGEPMFPGEEKPCLREKSEIVTPGSLAGDVVAKAIGSQQDWLVNVKNGVSAVVNAALNRMMTQGLKLISSSAIDNDGESVLFSERRDNLVTSQINSKKKSMIKDYNKFLTFYKPIFDLKRRSLALAEQDKILLTRMLQKGDCSPPVTDADITQIQSTIDTLSTEVTRLQGIIDDIDFRKNEINAISPDNRNREVDLATIKHGTYLEDNIEVYEEIIGRDNTQRASAQTEFNNLNNAFSDDERRSQFCGA